MFKKLLVPLDGSRFSSRAIVYASEVAQHFDAEIILLQVIKPTSPVPATAGDVPGMASPVGTEMTIQAALLSDKKNTARARRYLSRKLQPIKNKGIKVAREVIKGDPSKAIKDYAYEKHVDLVVMTTHGKSGLKRAIMGSVADAIIRESGIPVLVVKPQIKSSKRAKQSKNNQ